MKPKIVKSQSFTNAYWINGKYILTENIEFHKQNIDKFTIEELNEFELYLNK